MITKENYIYTGQENLPNPYWKKFFSMSVVGQEYVVLLDSEAVPFEVWHQEEVYETQAIENIIDNEAVMVDTQVLVRVDTICEMHTPDLVMSNTEYETYTNQDFYDACKEYTTPKVLSIGYGIGFILPEMASQNADLTIVEISQEVMDLNDAVDPSINLIMADINALDLSTLETYDVIFCDSYEDRSVVDNLKNYLKPGGQLIQWTHKEVTTE